MKATVRKIRLPKKSKSAAVETVLVLRTVDKDRKAYGGFVWPESGPVEAADWKSTAECGNGLHGFAKGVGDSSLLNWQCSALWQVVEVEKASIVDLKGKVKFPRGVVLYTGDRLTAANMVAERHPEAIVIGASKTAGYAGTATAGDRGTATAGYAGTATAGDSGTATAGDSGTATAGYAGTATAGDSGTATAGIRGTATAGYAGTATAGDRGTATAGYAGTATAGDSGTATAGIRGTATAGDSGIIQIRYYDQAKERYRIATAYIGEEGIQAGKKYRLDGSLKFVEVA